MGKIDRHANIYKNNILVRHVNDHGYLDSYTVEETEELVDKLANDKDENGNVKDPNALNNANAWLFQMYQKHGNPHEEELKELIKQYAEKKTTEEEAKQKIEELAFDLDKKSDSDSEILSTNIDTDRNSDDDGHDENGHGVLGNDENEVVMDRYVEFEEVA